MTTITETPISITGSSILSREDRSDGVHTGFRYRDFMGSATGALIRHRFAQNRDTKLSIESHAYTGLGKTTLGADLAEEIDPYWDHELQSFVDVDRYLKAYDMAKSYSCLLIDEFEREVDSRRAMSNKNVEFFQKMQLARYRNLCTVWCLPYLAAVDKRAPQIADINITIDRKGVGRPYYFSKLSYIRNGRAMLSIYPIRICDPDGYPEFIFWRRREDEVIEHLDELKREADMGELSRVARLTSEDIAKVEEEARREERRKLIRKLAMNLENGELVIGSQREIAEMFDVTQSWVSQIKQDA